MNDVILSKSEKIDAKDLYQKCSVHKNSELRKMRMVPLHDVQFRSRSNKGKSQGSSVPVNKKDSPSG